MQNKIKTSFRASNNITVLVNGTYFTLDLDHESIHATFGLDEEDREPEELYNEEIDNFNNAISDIEEALYKNHGWCLEIQPIEKNFKIDFNKLNINAYVSTSVKRVPEFEIEEEEEEE